MNFYDKLKSYKALNGLSWNVLGDVINKEATTMRIAVKRKSLSDLEIRELENKFFLENDSDPDNEKTDEKSIIRLKRKVGEPTQDELDRINFLFSYHYDTIKELNFVKLRNDVEISNIIAKIALQKGDLKENLIAYLQTKL